MFYSQKNYISFFIGAMLCQASVVYAQKIIISPDSTYHLHEVTVQGNAMQEISTHDKIDSSLVVMDNAIGIGGLLKYHSLVFIKDYGPGNLTSVSARGGSASQSQVFWNGININQAGLGMTDLSTLPPFLLDNITVQQSASAAASGSGSMAGNVLLSNDASSSIGAYGLLKQTISSIGEKSTGIRIGYNKGKWSTDVRYFYLNSDNTYHFNNTTARPYAQEQTQHNAGLIQQGYSATLHYNCSPNTKLSVYSWYTHFDRNIAPTLQTITKATQQDVAYRNSIQWTHQKKRSQWNYKLAYLRDQYVYAQRSAYSDSIIHPDHGYTNNAINQLDYAYDASAHMTLNVGVTDLYQSIFNENLAQDGKARNRLSLYGGVKWSGKRKYTLLTALVRQEWYALQHAPLIYSLQWDQRLTRNISLLVKGERQYRIPTLNDLYWGQGGNPNLKPEKGWGAEMSVLHASHYRAIKNSCTVTVFSRSIKDWILWTPQGGEYSYWTAQNINQVWSRGIEIRNDFQVQFSKQFSATLSWKHTYQHATREDPSASQSNVYHKQLIYTPVYLGNVGLMVQYKQFAISYYQQYTSWVFIQNDEGDFIDPYTYGMLRLQAGYTVGKNKADVFAEADNCWNTSYQTVKDRPMPLRYFRAGIIYKWN